MKNLLVCIAFFASMLSAAIAQMDQNESKEIYFDAVSFRAADTDTAARVDVYAIVPYQAVTFIRSSDLYYAGYDLFITVRDSSRKFSKEITKSRKITTDNYFAVQGGTTDFDYSQTTLNLAPGKYEVSVTVTDQNSKQTYSKSRTLTVIEFAKYQFSTSSILLLSSIEENNGKYKITPHLSDNVSAIKNNFYAFFELYNKTISDSVDVVYEILKPNEELVFKSTKIKLPIKPEVTRHYLRIQLPEKMKQGNYILRVIPLKPSNRIEYTKDDYLAIAERSIKYKSNFIGNVFSDLNLAIRQLRYVADYDEIEKMIAAPDDETRATLFDEFWKKLDPTPSTDRNEAFEEYYARINYANKNFRSATEGWMTDKGHVFIVYGNPTNVETSSRNNYGNIFERWTYSFQSKEFVFVDKNGFGDFKLYNPTAVFDTYHFRND